MPRIVDHWLEGVRRVPSPNQSARPPGEEPSLLVIHNISLPPGCYGGPHIDALFCNTLDCSVHEFFNEIKDLRVSAHLLIRRDGELVQYVPFDRKAWHAGKSVYAGREECNEFSIGIELEGCDDEGFTDRQYEQLQAVTCSLMASYPGLGPDRIAGHADIAPGRKTDPGPAFDWRRYRASLLTTKLSR
ncbi:MAG: 1,6-anhydro-N-acetylmuramyl-L-alanine amidase AmpD [Pseudomonadales bacterium]|nr:1,6-anhydro-N-acetylmuramyl-L-alanine amidase AmpD [Pseudomonadales bacterium]